MATQRRTRTRRTTKTKPEKDTAQREPDTHEEDTPKPARRRRTADAAPAKRRRTRARADDTGEAELKPATRRGRGGSRTTDEAAAEEPKPARRRRRTTKAADAEAEPAAEKPARRRRSRAKTGEAAEAERAAEPTTRRRRRSTRTADEAAEVESPRPRRRRRAAEPPAEKPEAAEEKPRRRRSRRPTKKAAPEPEPEAKAEAKPSRRKRGRKKEAAEPRRAQRKRPSRRGGGRERPVKGEPAVEITPAPRKPELKRELIANVNPRESRIALLENGVAVELFIDRPDTPNLVGSLILGRVDSIVPGIEAAFVDIGLEKNGFLYVQDIIGSPGDYDVLESLEQKARPRRYQRHHISKLLKLNQPIVVQVKKEPMGGKGTRLTSYITLPGRYCVLMPNVGQVGVSRKIDDEKERDRLRKIVRRVRPEGMGLILRTAAVGASEENIDRDVQHLVALWTKVQDKKRTAQPPAVLHRDMRGVLRVVRDVFTDDVQRLVIDNKSAYNAACDYLNVMAPHLVKRLEYYDEETPLFERYRLDEEITHALDSRVPLPSGGYLLIDQTEALVTIDVNTGKFTGRGRLEDTVYHTNLEAAVEVVRQLRLRDLGGIVLIDFIDMESPKYRREVERRLHEELQKDRTKTRVQKMSELCVVQLTRKRTKYSLLKTLCSQCPTCNARGWLRSVPTQALRILREIEMKTRHLEVEHVLVEAHPDIVEYCSHQFAHELADLEEHIEKLILLHPVTDRGPEYVNVIVEGTPIATSRTSQSGASTAASGSRAGKAAS